jgi:hypothetical protein
VCRRARAHDQRVEVVRGEVVPERRQPFPQQDVAVLDDHRRRPDERRDRRGRQHVAVAVVLQMRQLQRPLRSVPERRADARSGSGVGYDRGVGDPCALEGVEVVEEHRPIGDRRELPRRQADAGPLRRTPAVPCKYHGLGELHGHPTVRRPPNIR